MDTFYDISTSIIALKTPNIYIHRHYKGFS